MEFNLRNIFKRKKSSFTSSFSNSSLYSPKHITGATEFSCIDLIAKSFANLDCGFYGIESKNKLTAYHLYEVIKDPNIDEDGTLFWYACVRDYYDAGNVYLFKSYVEGRLISLHRLDPNKVVVTRNSFNKKIFTFDGIEYTSNEISHIASRLGYDGLTGKSIFSLCSHIFNTAAEVDSYVHNTFNHATGDRLVIDISGEGSKQTAEVISTVREEFAKHYTGVQNAGKPLIKTRSMSYDTVSTSPKDNKALELSENRAFQEKEMAKIFGVPLSLLTGKLDGDIESTYQIFIDNAILPLAEQFASAINKMIPQQDKQRFFFEYNYNSLMRTNLNSRIDAYAKQLTNAILTPNEVRRKENLPPIEAGDNCFLMANLMPLKDEIIDSYMAKSKMAQAELESMNFQSPGVNGTHDNKGDNKI